MAIQVLSDPAKEKSTYIITMDFEDEDGDPVIPDSITWTLTNDDGTVINEREDVSVDSGDVAASVEIVLSGDDLAILTGETKEYEKRRLEVYAVVDTDAGNNLPIRDHVVFHVENIKGVS